VCSNAKEAPLRSFQRLRSAQQRAHGLTSAVNETSVERPDGVRFCNPAFSTSAPAAHVLSTKLARRLFMM
jgi:hypothetical protein